MNKKISFIAIILVVFLFTGTTILGASAGMSISSSNVKPGDSVTVNVNITSVASYNLAITYSKNLQHVSGALNFADAPTGENVTQAINSLVFKALSDGTGTITLTGTIVEMVDGKKVSQNVNITKNVTVKTPDVVVPPTVNKSSNNYLKSLYVNVEGLAPSFNKTKTSYTLAVGSNVSSIKVTATPEDSTATASVSGASNLKNGDNTVTITVTAQNGSKRYYKILVTKTVDANKSDAYLENLVVENVTLTPEFSFETLEYDLGKVAGTVNKLNILAYARKQGAKIEIIGNDNLIEGENKIIVKVTALDGTTTKEYRLTVYKEKAEIAPKDDDQGQDEIDIYPSKNLNNTFSDDFFGLRAHATILNALIVILFTLCVVQLIQIIYLYNKCNNNVITNFFKGKSKKKEKIIQEEKVSTLEDDSKRRK